MTICRHCRGYRAEEVHLPHETMCMGHINAGGSSEGTSARCECPCTPLELKDELERQYNWRSWIKLSHVHEPDDVSVRGATFPLEEVHVTFVRDQHNDTTVRLTHEAAEELTRQLIDWRGGTRFMDTDTLAVFVAHAIRAAARGGPMATVDEIVRELPQGLDTAVRLQLNTVEATSSG